MIETRPSFQVQSRRRSSVADEEAPAATDDIVTSLAQRAKDLGNEAFRKQDYDGAIQHYTTSLELILEALTKGGTSTEAEEHGCIIKLRDVVLSNRAEAHLKVGNFDSAWQDSSAVQDPTALKALYRSATAALHLGKTSEARRKLNECLQLAEEDPKVLQLLAECREDELWGEARAAAVCKAKRDMEDLGPAVIDAGGKAASASVLLIIQKVVELLLDDSDETTETDPSALLEQLAECLLGNGSDGTALGSTDTATMEACAHFQACRGFPAVMSWLTESYRDQAARVLLAAGGGPLGLSPRGICRWPAQAVKQLLSFCTSKPDDAATRPAAPSEQHEVTVSSLKILQSVVRCRRIRQALPANEVAAVISCLRLPDGLGSSHRHALSAAVAQETVGFVAQMGCDAPSQAVLGAAAREAGVSNIVLCLLNLYRAVPSLRGTELLPEGVPPPPESPDQLKSADEALVFLEYQRRKVYNPPAIALRKAILACLADAARSPSLYGVASSEGQERVKCLLLLKAMIKDLHFSSPSSSAPEYGPDGKQKGFSNRKFAADYSENPVGDMLIHCLPKDLLGSKASDPVKEQCRPLYLTTTATDQTASLSGDGKPTLIEMALDALAACLEASPLQAPKAKLEEALQPLTAYYSSPSLLARLAAVYGRLAAGTSGVFDGLLDSSSAVVLVGLVHSKRRKQSRALERLAQAVDVMDGNDYAWLVSKGGGLETVHMLLMKEHKAESGGLTNGPAKDGFAKVVTKCAERARLHGNRGFCSMLLAAFGDLASLPQGTKLSIPASSGGASGFDPPPPKTGSGPLTHGGGSVPHAAVNGRKDRAMPQPSGAALATPDNCPAEGYDEDGIRTVWNSATAPEVRAARERWRKRLEEGGVVSWDQSSEDVHVAVQLPGNTTARGVKVEIAPKRLSVKLDWHGAVLEGELAHGIKAREATWSLEGSEIIILLPKDDKERVWRSLIKGGAEKGHYEVLQEMVAADEPHQPYDDIPIESKRLIEEIQERQALVSEGLLDLENSFDDFRVVLGDD